MYRIEVSVREGFADPRSEGLAKDVHDLGITTVKKARVSNIYLLEGTLTEAEAERIGRELLTDPIVEEFTYREKAPPADAHLIEVAYNPGVMDPVEESVKKGIRDLGITTVAAVRTARRYLLWGDLSTEAIASISDKLLVNSVVQHVVARREAVALPPAIYNFSLESIDLKNMDDDALMALSKGRFWLNLSEMKHIQGYFNQLGRNPTDAELETLAQTWSEHCIHKTFKSKIKLDGEIIDNLLKSTVMKATRELKKPWCLSVFRDNAGVIEFDKHHAICFKVETHNHPSAVEPYGGAATGIGGVIRDPLGTGLGAKPIANTDVFCFAPPDYPADKVPPGVLHPRRVMRGVVSGVRDYGNRMGIPTANGALYFDERYLGNPLVYCGNLGILPRDKCFKHQKAGHKIVLVGGRTGRDGIHGATFSSGELTHTTGSEFAHAVQIGNAIVEKKMVDTLLQARDLGLYSAITDCGAGGLSSAVGEMGEKLGAEVHLDRVPLKYDGLSYTEIWISEAQERMVLAVEPAKVDTLLALFASEDVEATVIGDFTDTGRLRLYYQGTRVADLQMQFLHNGVPRYERAAEWKNPVLPEPRLRPKTDYTKDLLGILGAWNVCSKEWVIRQYDHEVQGQTVIKPLVGVHEDAPGDACVITPILGSMKGLAIGCGMNPKFGDIDPYWMAAAGIDEAVRNVIAVGARPDRIAILDNFCWGNCEKPDRLGSLVLASKACYDVAMAFGTPFISGKDSLNNEFAAPGGKTIAIPPTLLISAIAIVDDVRKCVTMDLKEAGNPVYLVGMTKDELGGSHWLALRGEIGSTVPRIDLVMAPRLFKAVHKAIATGCIRACHDLSEGGLAVAAAEMAFAADLGLDITLKSVPRTAGLDDNGRILFSESTTRFLVEVPRKRAAEFERMMRGMPCARVAEVTKKPQLVVRGTGGKIVVKAACDALRKAWKKPLAW